MMLKTLSATLLATALLGLPTSADADDVPPSNPPPCTLTDGPTISNMPLENTQYHITTLSCPGYDDIETVYTHPVIIEMAPPNPPRTNLIPPCKWEDGSGQRVCFWDALHRGNRQGRSFISIREGGMEFIKYSTHRRIHRLGTIWRNR